MTNNYVDTKVTIWTRAYFTEDTDMKEVAKTVQKSTISHIYDNDGFIKCETLYDTELHISPKDNHGDATIEVYKGDEVIWENSEKH